MLSWRDDGSISVLTIGYCAIVVVLLIVGIDASKVFLAQRALSGAADSAALAAAQGIDRAAVYAGPGLGCGSRLPLSTTMASDLAQGSVTNDTPDLRHDFVSVDPAQVGVSDGTASVTLSGEVGIPFGRVLAWLDPSSGGHVRVSETAHAASPVVTAAGC